MLNGVGMRMKNTHPTPNLLDHIPHRSVVSGMSWWSRIALAVIAAAVITGTVFAFQSFSSVSKALAQATLGQSGTVFQQIQQLVAAPDKPLQGEARGQINILLMGIGGVGHDGPLLTDTMIVMAIRPSEGKVGLFSIPRDLVVDMGPKYYFRKINAADALGEQPNKPGSGAVFAAQTVEALIGSPIDYFVRVDFNGFAELVDALGGIDIHVDTTFTDDEYPTANYGYQTIHFTAGWQHMDGATSLKYVRTRHGNNGEGTDFARSKRQQKVLEALREKFFSISTLLNPAVVTNALSTLGKHVQTNFQVWELIRLAGVGKTLDRSNIVNRVLDTTPDGLLKSANGMDGAYILEPASGHYQDIQDAYTNLFNDQARLESATVEVQNGTKVAGLANRASLALAGLPVTVARIKNAALRNVAQTTIYDLTNGAKPRLLTKMQNQFHADLATALPIALQPTNAAPTLKELGATFSNSMSLQSLHESPDYQNIDFVIVLGSNASATINAGTNATTSNSNATNTNKAKTAAPKKPITNKSPANANTPGGAGSGLSRSRGSAGNTSTVSNINSSSAKTNGSSNSAAGSL